MWLVLVKDCSAAFAGSKAFLIVIVSESISLLYHSLNTAEPLSADDFPCLEPKKSWQTKIGDSDK